MKQLSTLLSGSRTRMTILLIFMSLVCFSLSVFRVYKTNHTLFLFLNWNLFLAFIPWALTSIVLLTPSLQGKKWVLFPLFISWILFFPNAPYILTDLFHLRINTKVPIWYDLVLILSFAWTGLLFGLVSLFDIERILSPFVHKRMITLISVSLLFLTGFGIYIGRFLRWNSWDILRRPTALLGDVADRFIDPASHPRTWAVTILMGLFLNMIYWSVRLLKKEETIRLQDQK
jgi:uncharacterized membrane protein